MHRAFGAMASVAREIALGTEARELVCKAALTSLDATMATVIEPREAGFAITGSAGIPLDRSQIRRVEPVASLQAFHRRQRIFIPNAGDDTRVSDHRARDRSRVDRVRADPARRGRSACSRSAGTLTARRRRQDRRDPALPRSRSRSLDRARRPARPARRPRAQRSADRTRQPSQLERRDRERTARPDPRSASR